MADDDKETSGVSDGQLLQEVIAREADVNNFLKKRDKSGALITALQNPPVGAKSSDIKVCNF